MPKAKKGQVQGQGDLSGFLGIPKPVALPKDQADLAPDSDGKRPFNRNWLADAKFKEWLVYSEEEDLMRCSFCLSAGLRNSFCRGTNNFRRSTLTEHLAIAEHAGQNTMSDPFQTFQTSPQAFQTH